MRPSISIWGYVRPSVRWSVRRSVWNAFFIPPKLGSFAQFKGQQWPWKCSRIVSTLLTTSICLILYSNLKTIRHRNFGKDDTSITSKLQDVQQADNNDYENNNHHNDNDNNNDNNYKNHNYPNKTTKKRRRIFVRQNLLSRKAVNY